MISKLPANHFILVNYLPRLNLLRADFFPVAFLLTADKNAIAKMDCWSLGTQASEQAMWVVGGGGGYEIEMGPKCLASPVLLALVFDLLTPLSFLSHPRSHNCFLITDFIRGRRTHWLSPFSLSSEIMGRMIRHPAFCTSSPTSQESHQFQAKEAS